MRSSYVSDRAASFAERQDERHLAEARTARLYNACHRDLAMKLPLVHSWLPFRSAHCALNRCARPWTGGKA